MSLSSHPQGLTSVKFKLSTFARKLLQRKMNVNTIVKSLHNMLNSMGVTAVHTGSGARSRKIRSYCATRFTVARQQTFTFDNCFKKTTYPTVFKLQPFKLAIKLAGKLLKKNREIYPEYVHCMLFLSKTVQHPSKGLGDRFNIFFFGQIHTVEWSL